MFYVAQLFGLKLCVVDWIMAMSTPSGPAWWVTGVPGRLAPWAQATMWALVKLNDSERLEMTADQMAAHVTKVGGGHPGRQAVNDWRALFAADPEWYPGKVAENRKKPGPKKLLTAQKANAIANCAMALKRSGLEPSAAAVKERCPDATHNPVTDEPFTDKYILEVFKDRCHDDGSSEMWKQWYPLQKTALPEFLQTQRLNWAKQMQIKDEAPGYFHRHVVWVDPCYNILTTSKRQSFDQDQAQYGKVKRWVSQDKRTYSRNLRSSPYGGKQQQFGDRKVWWFVVLARGKVHIEVMGNAWCQTGAGMAQFVEKLPGALKTMLDDPAALPRVIFSDRGPGFYQSSTGHIVKDYRAALQKHGFRAYAGEDASSQPPDVPDVLLHETAVAWIKTYFKKHKFSRSGSLDDQERKLRKLFLDCEDHINNNHDVTGLCMGFPRRLDKLVNVTKGDRLRT